ncbi:hypothetical protein [Parabacteroides merdae]|uniref:hypothetical protein n=1 Tax=Parabacteroides merdae TaxID=46503 RepID=UPI0021AB2003|nr:hypothetical protein [Parabacteroides merdae]
MIYICTYIYKRLNKIRYTQSVAQHPDCKGFPFRAVATPFFQADAEHGFAYALIGSTNRVFTNHNFTTLFIDEAA